MSNYETLVLTGLSAIILMNMIEDKDSNVNETLLVGLLAINAVVAVVAGIGLIIETKQKI